MKSYEDLEPDQLDCIDFIMSGEDSLIAADVGTGKTVISLTAANQCLSGGSVTRWLVIAPLLVATDTWAAEVMEWDHLDHVKLAVACGSEADRIAALESDANVVVINFENLAWLMEHYPKKGKKDTLPFDGLIIDELDKLKSVSSNRFKNFRNRIKVFKKRIGMTGTLIPNDLQEVWGQAYMVDGGASFGRSFYKWRKEYFYPTDFNQRQWAPFERTRQTIINTLGGLVYRLKAVGLPKVVFEPPFYRTLPAAVTPRYKTLEKDYYLAVNDDEGKRREVAAANAAVLAGKLMQITAGFSYVDAIKETVWHSQQKIMWVRDLYELLGSDQLLIFYHFQAELEALKQIMPPGLLKLLGGRQSMRQTRINIAQWNAGQIDLMAMHPGSAGHGLNLQKSGAHHIAFLTMPWSGGMWKQVIGRLARRGNPAQTIHVHTAVCIDTIDENVHGIASGRLDDMEDFLNDLLGAGAA